MKTIGFILISIALLSCTKNQICRDQVFGNSGWVQDSVSEPCIYYYCDDDTIRYDNPSDNIYNKTVGKFTFGEDCNYYDLHLITPFLGQDHITFTIIKNEGNIIWLQFSSSTSYYHRL